MRMILVAATVAVAAAALAACGGSDSTSPSTNGTNALSGNWLFHEALTNAGLALSCSDTAQVVVTQAGQTFTANYSQTGTCTQNGQVFDNSATGAIADGRIAGDSVSFSEDICAYRGILSGNPRNSMAGTVACTDTTSVPAVTVSGNWTMTR